MMIRALGWASTSAAQYYGVFTPQPGKKIHYTYSGYSFTAQSAMTTYCSGTVDTGLCSAQCSGAPLPLHSENV